MDGSGSGAIERPRKGPKRGRPPSATTSEQQETRKRLTDQKAREENRQAIVALTGIAPQLIELVKLFGANNIGGLLSKLIESTPQIKDLSVILSTLVHQRDELSELLRNEVQTVQNIQVALAGLGQQLQNERDGLTQSAQEIKAKMDEVSTQLEMLRNRNTTVMFQNSMNVPTDMGTVYSGGQNFMQTAPVAHGGRYSDNCPNLMQMRSPTATMTGLDDQNLMQMPPLTATVTGVDIFYQNLMQMPPPTTTMTRVDNQNLIQMPPPTTTVTGVDNYQNLMQMPPPTTTMTRVNNQMSSPTATMTEVDNQQMDEDDNIFDSVFNDGDGSNQNLPDDTEDVAQSSGSCLNDTGFDEEKVIRFLEQCDANVKRHVEYSHFDGLEMEIRKVGNNVFPPSLCPIANKIEKAYGDITENSTQSNFAAYPTRVMFCAAIREMDGLKELKDVTEDKLVTWRDAIIDAKQIKFNAEFAKEYLMKLARAYFGLAANHGLQHLFQEQARLVAELKAVTGKIKVREECFEETRNANFKPPTGLFSEPFAVPMS